ncbi:MAG: hypothetical protein AB4080_06520 [Trichodesmium sp.]
MPKIKNLEYIKTLLKYIEEQDHWYYQQEGSEYIQSIKKIEIAKIEFNTEDHSNPQFLVTFNLLFFKVNKYDVKDEDNIQFWRKQEIEVFYDGIDIIDEEDFADDIYEDI